MVDILLTFIGLLATAFSVASTLPQIRKALRTKDTEDVSIRFLIVLIIGLSLWAIYGVGKADIVILIGNSIGVSLNICMLVLKVRYSRKPMETGFSKDKNLSDQVARDLLHRDILFRFRGMEMSPSWVARAMTIITVPYGRFYGLEIHGHNQAPN